mmetsp:Transcript_30169/g.79772  ORF Transcript_30169/g.79772 Transcript_30169/m.79772 type:complete len:317 (+) Transcript_30169:75-1025(+)
MPRRRLQCGGCAAIIKVGSHVTRPVCPRCNTAHTFIKCGKPSCATLMCLPENVNQFSCPRCGVQLARPGFAQPKQPTVVRCGNSACSYLLSVAPGVTRFSCPQCRVVQLLPGTDEANKRKAELDEERRLKEQKSRDMAMLDDLCASFACFGVEKGVVEAVFGGCQNEKQKAVLALVNMIDNPILATRALQEAIRDQLEEMERKRAAVERGIRCPISDKVMDHPVFAADGYTYEREAIEAWLASSGESPVTKQPLEHRNLVPNHQLRGEIECWKEYEEDTKSASLPETVAVPSAGRGGQDAMAAIEVENVALGSLDD